MEPKDIYPGKKVLFNCSYPPAPEICTMSDFPYIWYSKEGKHISIALEEKPFNVDIDQLFDVDHFLMEGETK